MPRPKPINFNPPADLLDRLPARTIVTRGDKLKLLGEIENRAGGLIATGTNRTTFRAIEADVRAAGRAHKDSAPVVAEAPSKADQRSEAGPSIPEKALERKIGQFILRIYDGRIELSIHSDPELFTIALMPDEADQLAHALTELAGDLRQDVAARAWSKGLLKATTE